MFSVCKNKYSLKKETKVTKHLNDLHLNLFFNSI